MDAEKWYGSKSNPIVLGDNHDDWGFEEEEEEVGQESASGADSVQRLLTIERTFVASYHRPPVQIIG
uniref:Uncharacterized protein n=1 Tax=Caenorhabditis japonica TaxID=281687 RepID=A0A8R1E346_CAEJA